MPDEQCGCCGQWRSLANATCPNTADSQHSWEFNYPTDSDMLKRYEKEPHEE